MVAKQKYYVVWVGRKPGVYASWADCQEQINKFDEAKFKSYETKAAAEVAYKEGWKKHWGSGKTAGSAGSFKPKAIAAAVDSTEEIDYDSISVDVGTNGNPGPVEYKGVDTRTGEVIFAKGPIRKGTNNLGEFLAIATWLGVSAEDRQRQNRVQRFGQRVEMGQTKGGVFDAGQGRIHAGNLGFGRPGDPLA